MRHIRNFFHNINDIILVLIVVAVAAGVIFWRMQTILDYPKTALESHRTQGQTEDAEEETDSEAVGEKSDSEEAGEQADSEAAESETDSEAADGQSGEAAEGEQSGGEGAETSE